MLMSREVVPPTRDVGATQSLYIFFPPNLTSFNTNLTLVNIEKRGGIRFWNIQRKSKQNIRAEIRYAFGEIKIVENEYFLKARE